MNNSRLLGCSLIIAGTTIGAGMLALPLASAAIGFKYSLLLMIFFWALMTYSALLLVEAHQYADSNATLHTLAAQLLGKNAKWAVGFFMCFLFYALCAAYVAGGGSQLNLRIEQWISIKLSNGLTSLIFTAMIAFVVYLGTLAVDRVNRFLFAAKLITLICVLMLLTPSITQEYLLSKPLESSLILAAMPVVFTSFGFHGSIPALVRYLDGDTATLKRSIMIGSSIPLLIYVIWQLVTLGNIEQSVMSANPSLGGLISSLAILVHSPYLSQLIGIFADLALATSFLGVSLGLFEFVGDATRTGQTTKPRLAIMMMTFLPPLLFAMYYPQGFITALGYAALALAALALFIPVLLVIRARQIAPSHGHYQVFGGKIGLIAVTLSGILIVAVQMSITVGLLPNVG
ncbi:aromatic amino acid transporter [Vibrio sp. FNV 38]|nr:aromatic amino acid transporter [Vibrio sp. FNV 38]